MELVNKINAFIRRLQVLAIFSVVCQAHEMNKQDAMDHCKWRKMIKDVR